MPICGWEFIDPPEESWTHWCERLSLDHVMSPEPAGHVLDLFQEGATVNWHLDLRLWFDDVSVVDRQGGEIAFAQIVAGGLRWWDALYAGDSRTCGHAIVPSRGSEAASEDGMRPGNLDGSGSQNLSVWEPSSWLAWTTAQARV
jgi:hypothetical protein